MVEATEDRIRLEFNSRGDVRSEGLLSRIRVSESGSIVLDPQARQYDRFENRAVLSTTGEEGSEVNIETKTLFERRDSRHSHLLPFDEWQQADGAPARSGPFSLAWLGLLFLAPVGLALRTKNGRIYLILAVLSVSMLVTPVRRSEAAVLGFKHIGKVADFVDFPEATAELKKTPLLYQGESLKSVKSRGREVLAQVGLEERLGHFPTELSGGEIQRVALARALAPRPSIIFADEPTGNLDSRTGSRILHLFRKMKRGNVTLLMATHDNAVGSICDKVLKLKDGVLITRGET